MNNLKLGKLPKKEDSRNLKFAKYFTGTLPPIPMPIDHSEGITDWGMMLNNSIGDCAIAGPAHMIKAWCAKTTGYTPTDAEVLKAYSDISGYNPKTGSNDNGCAMLDVMKYLKNTGIGGHKIGAFVEVDIKNMQEILAGLYLFHGLDAGYQLPESAMKQFQNNQPFTIEKRAKIAGGHCMPILKADNNWFYPITWAKEVEANYAWIIKYMDECYVVISQDYFNGTKTAEGFDFATLTTDLALVSA